MRDKSPICCIVSRESLGTLEAGARYEVRAEAGKHGKPRALTDRALSSPLLEMTIDVDGESDQSIQACGGDPEPPTYL